MLPSFTVLLHIYKYILIVVALLAIIDFSLTYHINKNNILINNSYFNWHIKVGFIKFTCLKVVYVLWVAYSLVNPPGNAGTAGAVAILYCYAVITLIVAYLIGSTNNKSKASQN